MDTLYNSLFSLMDFLSSIPDFFNTIPDMFLDFMAYLNLWYLKVKLFFMIMMIQISYETAVLLLDEIGFNTLIQTAFNALPSELRFYAHEFGVVRGLTMFFNCFTTALVMRFSDW